MALRPARPKPTGDMKNSRCLDQNACLLKAMFGSQAQNNSLSRGLQVFANHVEHCFAGANAEPYKPFALAIDQDFSDKAASHSVMAAALVMVESLRGMQDAKTSIDGVLDGIFRSNSIASEEQISVRPLARQLLFAVIGTCSMIYQPALLSKTNSFSSFDLVRHDPELSTRINTDVCPRPISALLREFEIVQDFHVVPLDRSNALTTSNISFSALKGSCGVNISWVDSLNDHFVFNVDSRTLHLFRFPSCCAATYLGDDDSFLAKYGTIHCVHCTPTNGWTASWLGIIMPTQQRTARPQSANALLEKSCYRTDFSLLRTQSHDVSSQDFAII